MMVFDTYVQGIPCKCEVTLFTPYSEMKITGSGMGDADPPELPEMEFRLLDRKGYEAPWLYKKATQQDFANIEEEFQALMLAERFGKEY